MNDSTIKKLRQVQIQILDELVQICAENGLRYSLAYGTCLGAVRHKGYIPWDDDIDVIMPRKDFDRFINIALARGKEDFFLDYYMTNPHYGRSFAKYCKSNTLFIEPNGLRQSIFVDIFVLDKVPSLYFTKESRLPTFIHKLDAITTIRREGLFGRDTKTKVLYWLTRWIPIRWLFKLETKLMTRYEETDANFYLDYGILYNRERGVIPICEIEPFSHMEFEGKVYNVPRNWNLYLSNIYGDYMKIPPIEKRITHYPQFISFDSSNSGDSVEFTIYKK